MDAEPTVPLPAPGDTQPIWPVVDVDDEPRLGLLVRVLHGLRRL